MVSCLSIMKAIFSLVPTPSVELTRTGRAILATLLEVAAARQLPRVFLEVRVSNLTAIALYRRAGFSQVGLRRAYYRNAEGSEDALVMACELTGEANG